MTDFNTIETSLDRMVATGYEILIALEENDLEVEPVKRLIDKRGKQLQALDKTEVKKNQFSKEQKEKLRSFFTRLYVLEKKINKNFAKLSLNYSSTINDIDLHQKAKKSYAGRSVTGKFFDAQISG